MQNFTIQASLCSWAGCFEPFLFRNLKDRGWGQSIYEVQIIVYVEWAKKMVPCKFRDDFWRPI